MSGLFMITICTKCVLSLSPLPSSPSPLKALKGNQIGLNATLVEKIKKKQKQTKRKYTLHPKLEVRV